jgi:hypothetical protein
LFDQNEGYLVKEVEGLDPVDATLTYSSIANQDDEQEQSSKRVKRNLVLKLGYEPDYVNDSVKKLRDRLYGFFMPKTQVRLRFYADDMPTVEIVGRVEKMSAPLFARDPEATISIICAKSSFYELETLKTTGYTTSLATETVANYLGTIATGGLLKISPDRPIDTFTVYNRLPDDSVQSQVFVFPLIAGDVLDINSVSLSKYARVSRVGSSSTFSVLFGISPYSQWLTLYPGQNRFRVLAAGAEIPWSFQYVNKYGGL